MASRPMPENLKTWFNTPLAKIFQRTNVFLYRVSGGRLGGHMGRAPVLLLNVRGRKSGKVHTVPLLFLQDGSDYALVASKGGWPNDPLWYLNLKANPDVTIEVKRQQLVMTARTASDEERDRLWPRLVEIYPDYANYQSWTDRKIPVVLLQPRAN